MVTAALAAALAAFILGEYELTLGVAVIAGVVIGFGLAELVTTLGRWHGMVPALVAAVLTVGSMLWAGWIDSDEGVEPFPANAYVGAAAGAAVAVVTGRRRSPVRA